MLCRRRFFIYTGLLLLSVGISLSASAQFKHSDIPLISVNDFQAPVPRKARHWIGIQSQIRYRIDSVIRKGDQFRVVIKTKVEMQRDRSYWNRKKVKPKYEAQLLLHEQGHFYVSHIVANRLEAHIGKLLFSENYSQEVREKFDELHPKLYHQFSNY